MDPWRHRGSRRRHTVLTSSFRDIYIGKHTTETRRVKNFVLLGYGQLDYSVKTLSTQLEDVDNCKKMATEQIPQGADVTVLSKNEKKGRELIKKFNLKPIKGITRVTFRQKGNLIYAIDQPDVYRSAAGTYIVFGEATVDDMNKRIAEAQAQQAQQEALTKAAGEDKEVDKSPEAITNDLKNASLEDKKEEEPEEEGEVDESGLDSNDIDIIVEQTQVSRAKAVKALRKHDGDMVNAIMELS